MYYIGSLEVGAYSDRRTYIVAVGEVREVVEEETLRMCHKVVDLFSRHKKACDDKDHVLRTAIEEEYSELVGTDSHPYDPYGWEMHVDAFDKPMLGV